MSYFYNLNDIFILPAFAEPASYSVLEALSHGCPVICSTENGTKSYIKHNENGYIFNNKSRESLVNYILKITNRNNYFRMSDNAISYSLKYQNSEVFYDKIYNLINDK